jgi:hypothetical protein
MSGHSVHSEQLPRAAGLASRLAMAAVVVAVLAVLAALAVAAAARRERFTIGRTRTYISRVDGMGYRVHAGHAEPARAADTLAALNDRTIRLLRHLRRAYVRGGGRGVRTQAAAALLARYNPDNLAENSPQDPSGDTSYTIGKGAIVALCLRTRGAGGALHDLDTLTFVTLHEMAHIAIEDIDHPPRFWSAFRFLLEEAERAGIYTSARFAQRPQLYCGVLIDYNPRHDPKVASL